MTNPVLDAIRTRRVARAMTDQAVDRSLFEAVLEAGRWAPSAGNRRLHRFVAVENRLTLQLLRMVTPGMFQRPAAVVVICVDRARVASFGMPPAGKGPYIDVGTIGQTMLLAAHSLGLASGIVTSFSQAAVAAVLNFPRSLSPEMIICLGHASPVQPAPMRARRPITWRDLTDWERFADHR